MKRATTNTVSSAPSSLPTLASGLVSATTESLATTPSTKAILIEDAIFRPECPRIKNASQMSPSLEIISPKEETFAKRKFMHIKSTDKAEALNDQIDKFAERVAKKLGMTIDDFGQPGFQNPSTVTVVGRIVAESDDGGANSKLSEKGILLETSRQIGSGCRVPLTLECPCSFFPGQLVALEGSNPNGDAFRVSKQLQLDLFDCDRAMEMVEKTDTSIIVASGPFVMDKNADAFVRGDFMPFEKLLNLVAEQKPHFLILQGPFISEDNPIYQNTSMLPQEIFAKEFVARLRIVVSRFTGLKVVLVPSQKDLLCFPTLPQAPVGEETLVGLPSIQCCPNPCTVHLNGFTVALCSTEILLPLGAEEFNSAGAQDRITRLCTYVHSQTSVYPLHPAPLGVNIDYNNLDDLELPMRPDVYILSSQLRYFAKSLTSPSSNSDSKESLFVNTGVFCRKSSPGTAAMLHLTSTASRVEFYQF